MVRGDEIAMLKDALPGLTRELSDSKLEDTRHFKELTPTPHACHDEVFYSKHREAFRRRKAALLHPLVDTLSGKGSDKYTLYLSDG